MCEWGKYTDRSQQVELIVEDNISATLITRKMAPMGHYRFEYTLSHDDSFPVCNFTANTKQQMHFRGPREDGNAGKEMSSIDYNDNSCSSGAQRERFRLTLASELGDKNDSGEKRFRFDCLSSNKNVVVPTVWLIKVDE